MRPSYIDFSRNFEAGKLLNSKPKISVRSGFTWYINYHTSMTHYEGVKYQYYAKRHSKHHFDVSHDSVSNRKLEILKLKGFESNARFSAPEQFSVKNKKGL